MTLNRFKCSYLRQRVVAIFVVKSRRETIIQVTHLAGFLISVCLPKNFNGFFMKVVVSRGGRILSALSQRKYVMSIHSLKLKLCIYLCASEGWQWSKYYDAHKMLT